MKRVLVNTAENVHSYRSHITIALCVAAILCAVFYGANLYALVSHTVALRETERSIAKLSSQISDLDSQYLRLTSTITPDTLAQHGFSAGHITYIKRAQTTASIMPAQTLAQVGHEL